MSPYETSSLRRCSFACRRKWPALNCRSAPALAKVMSAPRLAATNRSLSPATDITGKRQPCTIPSWHALSCWPTISRKLRRVGGCCRPISRNSRSGSQRTIRLQIHSGFQHAQPRRSRYARPLGATPFSSGIDLDYLKTIENGIVKAIRQADAGIQPVSVKIGSSKPPDLLNDSRLPICLHDDLVVLEFTNAETKKRHGVLVQWNCHPEALGQKIRR